MTRDTRSEILSGEALIYDVHVPGRDGESGMPIDAVILHLPHTSIDAERLADGLRDFFAERPLPPELWVLGLRSETNELRRLVDHRSVRERLGKATDPAAGVRLRLLTIDADGTAFLDDETDQFVDQAAGAGLQTGLRVLFEENDGLVRAPNFYHFEKPGGMHTNAFLRSPNVLRTSAGVSLIGLALHRHLGAAPLARIHTDTSAIFAVALQLIDIRRRAGLPAGEGGISTFSGWAGLRAGAMNYESSDDLVLVSASSSGAIIRQLQRKYGVPEGRQIVLYHVGSDPMPSVLCDLTKSLGTDFDGLGTFPSWDPTTCPLCAVKQPFICFEGDQFLPQQLGTTSYLIKGTDAPPWLSSFALSVVGAGVVKAHVHDGSDDGRIRTLVLKTAPLLTTEDPRDGGRFERFLVAHVPASTSWIIHVEDPDSEHFAQQVRSYLARHGRDLDDAHVVDASEALPAALSDGDNSQTVLVVASVAASGRSLRNIGAQLRAIIGGKVIRYLIGISRIRSDLDWSRVKGALAWGENDPNFYAVVPMFNVHLPLDEGRISAWSAEDQFWVRARTDIENSGHVRTGDLLRALEDRRLAIRSAPSSGGLRDECFLPGFNRDATPYTLRLQPNFALWRWAFEDSPYLKGAGPLQPEVLMTVGAVLNALRSTRAHAPGPLLPNYNWVVLDPENFERFNDGVLRASLIRASIGRELDYSADLALSATMEEILVGQLRRWWLPNSGSICEFLLAIAMRRLRLHSDRRTELSAAIADVIRDESVPALLVGCAILAQMALEGDGSGLRAFRAPVR